MSPRGVDGRQPVIVGVGQYLQRVDDLAEALDPVGLMVEATRRAVADTGVHVDTVDAVRVVRQLTLRYADAPGELASRLGWSPRSTAQTPMGGNAPQAVLNASASAIQRGELDSVLIAGGEAWRSRTRARSLGVTLPWPAPATKSVAPVLGDESDLSLEDERRAGAHLPTHTYALFETALRAESGRTWDAHLSAVSTLWSAFSEVAVRNPYAWSRTLCPPEVVRTPTPENRMICFPYPKLMNSNNVVDMSAAILLFSADKAMSLGVPRDRWVFPVAAADCHEPLFLSQRWTFTSAPAITIGANTALRLAGVGRDDLALLELYSCFPSSVQLGAASLGLRLDGGEDRDLTCAGGLQFAGGPWNDYASHAIATMAERLRELPGESGLIWANGGFVTKHAFGVYSTTPPEHGFRWGNPQDDVDRLPARTPAPKGSDLRTGTVEAYTVAYDRDGAPERSLVAVVLPAGQRGWFTSDDRDVALGLLSDDPIGKRLG